MVIKYKMSDDFYSILELSKDASDKDIKKAYRKLTLKYHPDRNNSPDADEKIRKINEAYETLGDKRKRQLYDSGVQEGGFPGGFPFPGGDMNNIFNMFFNGGGIPGTSGGEPGVRFFHNGMPQFMKPPPIQHISVISFEQAYNGCSLEIRLNKTGSSESELITVPIPPGFDNEVFVLQERGNVVGNCRGDVHVIIKVENKTNFIRQNMDLIYRKNLSLKESLCGFSFDIVNLEGKTFTVRNDKEHSIISPNHKMIIPNMGMKRNGQSNGNLIIEFVVEFPLVLTDEQRSSLSKIL